MLFLDFGSLGHLTLALQGMCGGTLIPRDK